MPLTLSGGKSLSVSSPLCFFYLLTIIIYWLWSLFHSVEESLSGCSTSLPMLRIRVFPFALSLWWFVHLSKKREEKSRHLIEVTHNMALFVDNWKIIRWCGLVLCSAITGALRIASSPYACYLSCWLNIVSSWLRNYIIFLTSLQF